MVTQSHSHTEKQKYSHTVTQSYRKKEIQSYSHTVIVTQSYSHTVIVTQSYSHKVIQSYRTTLIVSELFTFQPVRWTQ